jgi:hypothetical protein
MTLRALLNQLLKKAEAAPARQVDPAAIAEGPQT